MIKMPREVTDLINKFSNEGFEIFAVGGCVRDSIMGKKPIDWDLTTNATIEDMKRLIPSGRVLSEKLEVLRVDFTKSEEDLKSPIVDIARFRKETDFNESGMPQNVEFTSNIQEDLPRRDFTINAIADNGKSALVDIFEGREDIKLKRIKAIGDADIRFQEDPLRMLRAVRLCSEKDFNIEDKTYESIKKNAHLLNNISRDKLREEFVKIVESPYVNKGFTILFDTGLIKAIAQVDKRDFRGKRKVLLSKFLKNIQMTYPILERRLTVFYSLLKKAERFASIDSLNYNKVLKNKIKVGLLKIEEVGVIKNDVELKAFIRDEGLETYEFVDSLSQDKVVIYGGSPSRINKRQKYMKAIKERREAIFIKDLAVDGRDLIDEGIEEQVVGDVLECLILDVHRKPFINNRASLTKIAKDYATSSLKRKLRLNKTLRKLR